MKNNEIDKINIKWKQNNTSEKKRKHKNAKKDKIKNNEINKLNKINIKWK